MESAPIIIIINETVAYFRYILPIMKMPHTISIIATRKRVVLGNGSPKCKKTSLKLGTNIFTIPDEMKTYPIT